MKYCFYICVVLERIGYIGLKESEVAELVDDHDRTN